jgi:DNA-binding PadR family transcriptional regulator
MELTNVEFILLQIICDKIEVSGYEINQLIKERGYKEWADIGTTSIYVSLNKLSGKQLVNSYMDMAKQGRGPLPRKFTITNEGKSVLQQEIIAALSSSRERDYRFDLALAAIPFLTTAEVVAALKNRKDFLLDVADNINHKLEVRDEKKVPINLRALYWHPLLLIKHEIEFMDSLIQDLVAK